MTSEQVVPVYPTFPTSRKYNKSSLEAAINRKKNTSLPLEEMLMSSNYDLNFRNPFDAEVDPKCSTLSSNEDANAEFDTFEKLHQVGGDSEDLNGVSCPTPEYSTSYSSLADDTRRYPGQQLLDWRGRRRQIVKTPTAMSIALGSPYVPDGNQCPQVLECAS